MEPRFITYADRVFVPASRRTICYYDSLNYSYFHLSFPDMEFARQNFYDKFYYVVFTTYKNTYFGSKYTLPLPNLVNSHQICFSDEIVPKNTLETIHLFWNTRFNGRIAGLAGPLNLHTYNFLNRWQESTLKDKKWVPDLKYFGNASESILL